MKNIGKYRGVDCFECDNLEWQAVGKNFPEIIFVINGIMVKNGIVIGHYNGNTVKENWDGKKYSTRVLSDYQTEVAIGRAQEKEVPEFFENDKKEVKVKMETSKETEVNFDTKMDWASYSSVVDEFFANLKDFDSWKV